MKSVRHLVLAVCFLYGNIGLAGALLQTSSGAEAERAETALVLKIAAYSRQHAIVKAALTLPVNVDDAEDHKDSMGAPTALFWAAHEGSAKIVRLLAAAGANVNLPNRGPARCIPTIHGSTIPPRTGHLGEIGYTPLFAAAVRGHLAAVKALVTLGANVNGANEHVERLGAPAYAGYTPLHGAVLGGKEEVVAFLLEQDADIGSMTPDKKTPVRLAREEGRTSIADLLRAKANELMGLD